jgi:enamine deaminase RidA (YjgF/YER057c/UK114 family)
MNRWTKGALGALSVWATSASLAAAAPQIVRTPAPSATAPLATAVTVPAGSDLVFLSGALPPAVAGAPAGGTQAFGGDTQAQTVAALTRLKATLTGLGLTFGDVVQAHVFLAGDPAKGGDIDFAGLNAGWSQFFGTADQPNKPARSTVKVAALVAPGALVEIEVVAAKVR